MMGLKPENDIIKYLKAPDRGTQEIHGLTRQSKKQNSSNLFNPRLRRTINQSSGKIVQGSKFDVVTNRRVSNIQPIQGIQPIQLIHSNHSFYSIPFLIILFFLLFLTASGFSQRIIHVSPNGSSIPPYNSWETAADSLNKAMRIFQNGDTILVGAGIYQEQYTDYYGGKSYTIIGTDPDSCIFDISYVNVPSGTTAYALRFWGFDAGDIITLKNLSFQSSRNNAHCGVLITGYLNQYMVENLKFHSNLSIGLGAWAAKGIVRNSMFYSYNGIGIARRGISDSIFIIENNIFFGNRSGAAVGVSQNGTAIMRNNFLIKAGVAFSYDPAWVGNEWVVLQNNLFAGYKSSAGSLTGVGARLHRGKVQNNVFTNLDIGVVDYIPIKVQNNIFLNVKTAISDYTLLSAKGYNMFAQVSNVSNHKFSYIIDSTEIICSDPMFVKSLPEDLGQKMPTNYDYRLEAYSPAIDKGNPEIIDKDGSRSDMGMYGGPWGESYEYQDNPPKQVKITKALTIADGICELNWRGGTEVDFREFRVYRHTDPNFIPDSSNLIYIGKDTILSDTVNKTVWYSYKIHAVDKQGKFGKSDSVYFSLSGTETDPPVMTPKGYKLYHNYPNPFNPVTKIKFRIEAENEVILRVYNVEGEIVSVLENGILPAGEYEREFSPKSRGTLEDLSSGVYFYRLIVRDNNKRPVFMDAGKMVMVK